MNPAADSEQLIRVAEFQRKHRVGLLTLLFTDMAGSTKLKQDLGDREAVMLIQYHHSVVREILEAFQEGEEISTAGDSFFIVFAKPSDAAKFSLTLQSRLRELKLQFPSFVSDRVGIHVGEVFVEQCESTKKSIDLYGIQVDTAARVMSLAQGGQILMTRFAFDNARQVLRGEDIFGLGPLSWLNHGPYQLKGVEEAVEICEVGEDGAAPLTPPADSDKATRHLPPGADPVLGWRPAVGQFVPNTKWLLKEKLGEGGFGEVWLGSHEVLHKQRVFKFCFRADRVRSLKREVTFFRVLIERIGEHPNIVGVEDIYFEEPPYYIVMSYAEGKDLAAWSQNQGGLEQIPLAERLEIVAQVADGLHAAHEAGVIHCDVKPSNILVTGGSNGQLQVKLTDFGVGQAVSAEVLQGISLGITLVSESVASPNSSTQTGTFMYMPPEFMSGKTATPKADVYSLGVVLFQVIVGDLSRPLGADWPDEVSCPVLRGDLKRCFARNPDDRPTAGDLAMLLRSYDERKIAYDEEQTTLALNPPQQAMAPGDSTTRFAPFVFSNGAQARNVASLKELCRSWPVEAVARLRDGRIETWLRHCGADSEADRLKAIRESAGEDGEAALEEFMSGTRPFIFRTGEQVVGLDEWFAYAQKNSADARYQLYGDEFQRWLRYRGWDSWAETAQKIRESEPDQEIGLENFQKEWTVHRTARELEKVLRAEMESFSSKSRLYRRRLLWRSLGVAIIGAALGWSAEQFLDLNQTLGLSLGIVHPSPWRWASPLAGYVAGSLVFLTGFFACVMRWWRWRPHWKNKGIRPAKEAFAKAPEAMREFVRFRRKENHRTFRPVFLLALLLAPLGFAGNYFYGLEWKERLTLGRLTRESKVPLGIARQTNSLGMVFVKVPRTSVQFSVWETRRKDFAAFTAATAKSHNVGTTNRFSRTNELDLPVANVSFEDAEKFCQWLTKKEHKDGVLPLKAEYRLPKDREWSAAVGLAAEEGFSPSDLSAKIADEFPWGKDWPPPPGAGNFLDAYAFNLNSANKVFARMDLMTKEWEQFMASHPTARKSKQVEKTRSNDSHEPIPGYGDGFAALSPVGSFAPNPLGIYDLEGNVSEWCEDWFDTDQIQKVSRGGNAWEGQREKLFSSFRQANPPTHADATLGFRVVIDSGE